MTTAGTSPLPRLRDRVATEGAIVEAAERLLVRGGWSGVNVQTLAAEAGVDRKLVYRYFDGVDGVIDRLAGASELWLGRSLAAAPPSQAATYRDFAREMLKAYLAALRANPVMLRLLAWEMTEDSPLLRRLEARRSEVLQAWVRDRRPRLRQPPQGDMPALNIVLLAAVQHLALAGAQREAFGGVALDDSGWARVDAALDRLLDAYPD
jgi:AcrR family transcriptional regulator